MPPVLSTQISALLDLWRSRLDGQDVPRRSAFAAEEFKAWMGNIAICEVERRPLRFRLRLVGTNIAAYDGRDYTGQYLDEVLQQPLRDHVLRQWFRCVEARKPLAVRYESPDVLGAPLLLEKLFLPLTTGGSEIGQVLAYIRANREWAAGMRSLTLKDFELDGRSEMTVLDGHGV